ncbi:RelE/StbE replicon stabilization toxin [uncultured Candidatus Thioglobus sp.]|nr:RelE/StbE replicon stabilization toxin [uncultured Candidatus Thioglobus sp.]
MSYKLKFMPKALKSFAKLNPELKAQFKKQLDKRLENPCIEKYRLHGDYQGHYKIKLLAAGYRMIYRVINDECVVLVVEVNRRDKIYKS